MLFALTPSIILLSVNIWATVDLLGRKPFWFTLSRMSITLLIRFKIRRLYILAMMQIRLIPL